jgi:hypothetical protein
MPKLLLLQILSRLVASSLLLRWFGDSLEFCLKEAVNVASEIWYNVSFGKWVTLGNINGKGESGW